MAKKDGKESTIGKVIYGFLMFAPLLAVLSSCAYSILNKNATENFTRKEQVQPTTLIVDKQYHWKNENIITGLNGTINFNNISNLNVIGNKWEADTSNFAFVFSSSTYNYLWVGVDIYDNPLCEFDFTYKSGEYTQFLDYITETKTYTENRDLRNTFYYSLEQVEEQLVFSWAKNNEIYTGLKAVTNGIGIEASFYPLILSYWLIISLIYFMYDILLIIFHILHTNIHKLEQI